MQITYNNEIKERFIPIAYDELLKSCATYLDIKDIDTYQSLSSVIHLYYYQAFYSKLQQLKESYAPFNPDSDVLTLSLTKEEYHDREMSLFAHITPILNHANYEILTQEALQETMNKTSPYGVEVSVDFDDFEKIQLYFRGESIQEDERRDPSKLYLGTKIHSEPLYRRLFIIIKPKHIDTRAKEIAKRDGKDIDKVRKKLLQENPFLITDSSNKSIYIKLFKNIPQMDLEMLFPNTKVKITLFDKIKLGLLGGGGTVGGGSTLIAKLSVAAIDPISALMALGAFGGVVWRQVKEVFTRRTHYMAQLAKNLYFHNLDNNAGALNYMIDMASEEESKETLLVYLFLSQSATAITKKELDSTIELYIHTTYQIEMDFEVDDGLRKLRTLGLLIEDGEYLSVVESSHAVELLS